VKHNYVIQAIFDLQLWPECKTASELTEGITWGIKVFSSDTLCLIKDTDKEDREKALKVSWETNDPGRAEKAAKSRTRFLLQRKQRNGEELTEEELEILKEKRERVRKKDQEEQVPVKGAKGKAGGKADPKKNAKGAPPPEKVEEEDDSKKRQLPEPESHVNNNIVAFLKHYKAPRLITVPCADPDTNGRKRSDDERTQMKTTKVERKEEERA